MIYYVIALLWTQKGFNIQISKIQRRFIQIHEMSAQSV